MPTLPTLTVSLGRSGWLLGDSAKSLLGISTTLGISEFDALPVADIRRVSIRQGRQHELNRPEASVMGMRLANPRDDYNPVNTSSPYHPDIRPMIPIRVQATFSAVTYDLFTGFVEAWPQRYGPGPAGDAFVDVTAVDAFKVLNLVKVTGSFPQQDSGARVDAILDAIGWPAGDRDVDVGNFAVQASDLAGVTALSHIQQVADSEGGLFFMAANGDATFYNSSHQVVLDDANDTWGDAGTEKHYEEVAFADTDSYLWNEVVVTADGLTDQVARDEFSIAQTIAPRTLPVSTLLTTEADMLTRAETLVGKYGRHKNRVQSLVLPLNADDASWPRILPKQQGDRILVRKRPPVGGLIEQPSVIEGRTMDIVGGIRWRWTWALSSTNFQAGQWVLGDASDSLLGQTTSLF